MADPYAEAPGAIRYTLEREQNRKVAISVGVRPSAHRSKTWKARR
jgi:hypothetical protein